MTSSTNNVVSALRRSLLTAKGTGFVLQRGNGRRVQVKRARPDRWAEETGHRILTALAGTCNARMAAEAVETSAPPPHARRRLDPGFARAWAEALAIGYARLEAIQSLNRNVMAVKGLGAN